MTSPGTFAQIALLLRMAASVLRQLSITDRETGFVSEETRLADRVDALAGDVAKLARPRQ